MITDNDERTMRAFRNFLSWGQEPNLWPTAVPPAWWAYVWGVSEYCPPKGTL